jgi:hypothetical protein
VENRINVWRGWVAGRRDQRRWGTKGNGSRTACLTMVFKLVQSAAKRWRLLNGSELLPDVIRGIVFQDGLRNNQDAA